MKEVTISTVMGSCLAMLLLFGFVAVEDSLAQFDDPKQCTVCHAALTPVAQEEWAASAHSTSLETLGTSDHAGDSCLRCMSAEYRMAPEDAKPTLETVEESISCGACHDHSSDLEHKLVVSAAENCQQCHTMGTAAPGGSPHHPQGELFAGIGAAGVPEMPSEHAVLEGKCAYCHMYKEGEEAATVGGHTFLADPKACEDCHTDPEAMIAAMHEDVGGLLAGLTPMLEAVPEEERETDAYKEALFNSEMVAVDGSGGVHNYSYAKAALGHSYQALGSTAPIVYNCETCHAESVQYAEWKDTAHARSLIDNPISGNNCLVCKAASDVKQDPNVTFETATLGIACNACHNHGSGMEHNLLVSAAENCIECHTMGTAVPGREPHHPQREIFLGIGGAGVPEMESGHNKTMPDKCVVCHMYKAGEEVASEGGHTFHANLESCTGCHADGPALMANIQTKVNILLEGLNVALEAVPEEERETDAYKEAAFNYHMVEVDKSEGVHNSAYAVALLEYAYSALGAEVPDFGEGGVVAEEGEFNLSLAKGLNMMSIPLKPGIPYTARSLAQKLGATTVIKYDTNLGRFVGFTEAHTGDGFAIEGGMGYIVNLKEAMDVTFEGSMWTNEASAAPPNVSDNSWAFVMTGFVHDRSYKAALPDEYTATVKNLRTGTSAFDMVGVSGEGMFTAVWADLSRRSVVEVGDSLEIVIRNAAGEIVSGPIIHQVTVEDIERAFATMMMELGNIIPKESMLAQNYPNPFNPDTWIPYQLAQEANVTVRIYSTSGRLVRILDLGRRDAGMYLSKHRAAYWDGRDDNGELVSSGVYVYSIQAGEFTSVKKMVVLK